MAEMGVSVTCQRFPKLTRLVNGAKITHDWQRTYTRAIIARVPK